MRFEWDEAKDLSNQKKHGLSFAEARQLFEGNQDYLEIFDAAHSETEDRFIAIGNIDRGLAVVVYTEREEDLIRIIGARFATRRELERYHAYMERQK
jgi:uncharacterized protein